MEGEIGHCGPTLCLVFPNSPLCSYRMVGATQQNVALVPG